MLALRALKNPLKISYLFDLFKFHQDFYKSHPDYFSYDGFTCFVGGQGAGKTLSAVLYTLRLLHAFPECKLCTNVEISGYPIVTYEDYLKSHENATFDDYVTNNRVFLFQDNDDFLKYGNGERGIIFFVDEIHIYLSSLENKNVNPEVVAFLCQQRKQRVHVVATSQKFGQVHKRARQQFSSIVYCQCFFKCLQKNCVIDRSSIEEKDVGSQELTGKIIKKYFWFHHPDYYALYDTYAVLQKQLPKFAAGEKMLPLDADSNFNLTATIQPEQPKKGGFFK